MGINFRIPTIISMVDQTSGTLGAVSKNIDTFRARAKLAFTSLVPGGALISKAIGSIAGQVALGTLAVKGLSAAANTLKNTITSIPEFAARADVIGKQAQIIGMNAEELQRYQYAAKMSNVSNELLMTSFQKLNQAMGSGKLFSALEGSKSKAGLDAGLSKQLRAAKDTSQAFMILTDAMSKETDMGKRAAIMQAALGKSGAALIPMLKDGAAAMREMMDIAPNVISERTIAISTIFGDTVTHIKESIASFFNTIKSGILEAITPYVLLLRDWIDEHRELIKVKIQEFLRGAVSLIGKIRPLIPVIIEKVRGFIGFVKPFVVWAIDNLPKLIPIITGIIGAFLTFSAVVKVIDTVKGAITGLQAVLAMGPFGIIMLLVSLLITGFILLSQKVGGFGKALEVIGETALAVGKLILKNLFLPITLAVNLIIEIVQGVVALIGKIPGIGDAMKSVNDKIQGFQNAYNEMWMPSGADIDAITDPYRNARQSYLEEQAAKDTADKAEWDKIVDRLNKLIDGQKANTAAVEGLGDNSERAKGLTYAQMGVSDIWDIIEAGAH